MRCPFAPCAAGLDPVRERTAPGDDQATREVYPMHVVVGPFAWFGGCPASLMVVPVGVRATVPLVEAETHLYREAARRAGLPQPAPSHDNGTGGHLGHVADHPRKEYFPLR